MSDLYPKLAAAPILAPRRGYEWDGHYWLLDGGRVDPLVEWHWAYERAKENRRRALLCMAFGWYWDSPDDRRRRGYEPDHEDEGEPMDGCATPHTEEWPLVAVFDSHSYFHPDLGTGWRWTEVRVNPCEGVWEVGVEEMETL